MSMVEGLVIFNKSPSEMTKAVQSHIEFGDKLRNKHLN
jgi:hypothetical protein